MNVGSVNSAYNALATQSLQGTPETAEVQKGGHDNDGDADDNAVKAVQSPPTPTVNSAGQTIGQLINVTA